MIDLGAILRPESQAFINQHLGQDPAQLMLSSRGVEGVPLVDLVNQIKARQIVKEKLPLWSTYSNLVYPHSIPLQQCSSQVTAEYKSTLVHGDHLIDLTGGLGVDSYFFSKSFRKVTYVESSAALCEIAKHNFQVLEADNVEVVHADSNLFVSSLATDIDTIYIDPTRRSRGTRVFQLEHTAPNILILQKEIHEKSKRLLLKASPLLEIKRALDHLLHVLEVHVVSSRNDCKELLFLADDSFKGCPRIFAVEITSQQQKYEVGFTIAEEEAASASYADPQYYLYEPFAGVLKAGPFKLLSSRFKLHKLHANSQLYTSQEAAPNFPGRIFRIKWTHAYKKRKLRGQLQHGKANITVRNFPYTVREIRKDTGITEGGQEYLFATTLASGQLVIICGERIEGVPH